jgi:hypothetical protein
MSDVGYHSAHLQEKRKMGMGEVLLIEETDEKLVHITSSRTTLLRIPYSTFLSISMSEYTS